MLLPATAGLQSAAEIVKVIERHRKADNGYGWLSRVDGHITPTFAAVACYRLLGMSVPDAEAVAEFARTHYPVPDGLSQQPLWRLDYEQAQVLLWLGHDMDTSKAAQWQKPLAYNTYFEQNGYPTLQHQAMAVRLRKISGEHGGSTTQEWESYFNERQRNNGTYNNAPAADGSDGHIVNTVWAIDALEDLGIRKHLSEAGISWIKDCQMPGGGFTWSPLAELGRQENMIYTWAAIKLLARAGSAPKNKAACIRWIEEQRDVQGGYRSNAASFANLTATYYALDALRILGASHRAAGNARSTVSRPSLPAAIKIFTAQIEAPGNGSPAEAVMLAEHLKIDLWTAKNSSPGWIQQAQTIADRRGSRIRFAQGNEEYGTYTSVAGFGMYSHLDDLVAPGDVDLGPYPPQKNVGMPWTLFRDTRIRKVLAERGRMIWQFNENEELTRILLDEAARTHSYAAVSSFHFGLDDFLEFEPFLMEWEGRLPMIGLQDAHGGESWWWAEQLAGFRTLYLAEDASWEGFLKALDNKWTLSVRHDRSRNGETQWSGALPEVRRFIEEREEQWAWWKNDKPSVPLAAVTKLEANAPFEAGAPEDGVSLRIRLRYDTGSSPNNQAFLEPQTALLSLEVDGREVRPEAVEAKADRYLICRRVSANARQATAVVRDMATGKVETIHVDLKPFALQGD
ncbi:prenyltransferase/squalene oxidase repeat-containing protein [Silvibacterium acidisoli]|uniref:prenyltransferase/squalene oxidase repeat-containing protein n=1 Tax=Acidobacteriaceae bacterium ZG23-2 TaxID=2883246 RepID=UPI00406C7A16